MTKNNLRFVIDNWHVNDWAFKDKKRVQYLIAAITAESCMDHDYHAMQELKAKLLEMNDQT